MRKLTFDAPAADWNEALPIGNGRLGAMIFGGAGHERVQLNDDSIWYGGPQDRCNPDAKTYLPEVRRLILEQGDLPAAQELMTYALSGTPQSQRPYQSAGDLWLDWSDKENENFHRALDLEQGLATAEYTAGGGTVRKEYLASYPAGVLAIRLSTTAPAGLHFAAMLTRERYYDGTGALGADGICLWGSGGEGGVRFTIGLRAEAVGGTCKVIGEHLLVDGASEATLYLAIETSFYEKGDLTRAAAAKLNAAAALGYAALRRDAVADYKRLYDRVELTLGDGQTPDPELQNVTDYFQFGRYLTIAGSRPGSLPSNLQGIWNSSMTPPWDSKYTININTEMNYWPTESCNLPECHLPLFELLKRMRPRGAEVAKAMYGCRGFVAHHNTDIWADCAPQDIYPPATYWVMGAAWLCMDIWRHYAYTGDKAFLAELYPVLKDAVLFFHDYLVEYQGKLVTCPSVSPENTYILPSGVAGCVCAGATMDNEMLRELFGDYLKASEVLGIEDGQTAKSREILEKLPPLQIGKHGQIVEWWQDYEEWEPGHRHISQLYALHPGHEITPDKTPELAEAARKTLERRLQYGGGHTGWSCAWIVNMYARLFDGENAWKNLQKLFAKSTFPNHMTNHPAGDGFVFQIDGNFGAASGIVEMLLQSDADRTILLPALPARWSAGQVRGLVLYGGATVEMAWAAGTLTSAVIRTEHPIQTTVRWPGGERAIALAPGERVKLV